MGNFLLNGGVKMFDKKIELKVACLEKGITQRELAKRLGVTSVYISYVIMGVRELGDNRKIEAARILSKPRELLFK